MLTKIDWIKTQLLVGENASEAASRLNTPSEVDNPTPQATVSIPIDVDKMWEIVPPAEVYKVLNTLIWERVVTAISVSNKALVSRYITALVAGGALSPTTAQTVAKALSGSVLDPNWKPQITASPAKLAGFTAVLVDEVQEILDAQAS